MKINNKIQQFLIISYILTPSFLFAQTFKTFAGKVIDVLNSAAMLIMALSLLLFIIGIVRFIATAGDDNSRAEGKQLMVWGTISLFAMVSVWGLVTIIRSTFFG